MTYRLFLDIDSGDRWLWRLNDPLWDDLLQLVRMEAKRLAGLYELGNLAVIYRSDNGWHLIYPKADLTKEEEESIMTVSRGHRGHIYFSILLHDTTLRISEKNRPHSHKPYLKEVIRLNG